MYAQGPKVRKSCGCNRHVDGLVHTLRSVSVKREPTVKASDRAYETLRREILDGDIAPGALLYGVDLAERLNVSRTPVRDALTRLQSEGLVTSSGRGFTVTQIEENDVRALFELRASLESTAAQLAARRGNPEEFDQFALAFRQARHTLAQEPSKDDIADYYQLIRRFDRAIDNACDNQYLVDSLEALRVHVSRARRMAGWSAPRLLASAEEHALIAEAIAAQDAVLAGHATQIHLHKSLEHFRHAIAARRASA